MEETLKEYMREPYSLCKIGPMDTDFSYNNTDEDYARFMLFLERNGIDMVQSDNFAQTAYQGTFYGSKRALEKMIWNWFSYGYWDPRYPMDFSNEEFWEYVEMIEQA